jgi:hypothetical protein
MEDVLRDAVTIAETAGYTASEEEVLQGRSWRGIGSPNALRSYKPTE